MLIGIVSRFRVNSRGYKLFTKESEFYFFLILLHQRFGDRSSDLNMILFIYPMHLYIVQVVDPEVVYNEI